MGGGGGVLWRSLGLECRFGFVELGVGLLFEQ